jgi:YVTN family beta-propeller protein
MRKLALLTIIALAMSAFAQNYKVKKRYVLGGEGFWDYLAYDTQGHRLFITRGNHVMVVDPKDGKQIGDIPAHFCHGVAFDYSNGRGFISNGGAGTVTVFDLKTLKPIQDVKVGENPDAIIYDQHAKKVIVMNGRSKNVMVIDPQTLKVDATIDVAAKPEFAQADAGHVYVNLEDTSHLAEINSKTWKLENKWPLAPCESPSGLAIDTRSERLFPVCASKVMDVVDAKTGKIVTTVPIGEGPDAARFYNAKKLVFSSNGRSGTLTIAKEESANKYKVVQTLDTQLGARTMELDQQTGTIYLITAEFEPPAQPGQRPSMKPGSFTLLVVSPQ